MEPYIGQIQTFAFNYAPRGWAKCDGTLLAIANYQSLFALIGTTYGGDGRVNFALPDLRSRNIVHQGQGPGLDTVTLGERGGKIYETLSVSNMPVHNHLLVDGVAKVKVGTASGGDTSESDNGTNSLLTEGLEMYSENSPAGDFAGGVNISGATNNTGGGQAFNMRNPFLGMNVCIALDGLFPPRP